MAKRKILNLIVKLFVLNMTRVSLIGLCIFFATFVCLKVFAAGKGNSILMLSAFLPSLLICLFGLFAFVVSAIVAMSASRMNFAGSQKKVLDLSKEGDDPRIRVRTALKHYTYVEESNGTGVLWLACSGFSMRSWGEIVAISLLAAPARIEVSGKLLFPTLMEISRKKTADVDAILRSIAADNRV